MNQSRVLGAIFAQGLLGAAVTRRRLAEVLDLDKKELESRLKTLGANGYIRLRRGRVSLTAEGRRRIRVVFVGGGFEIIHTGHLYTLDQAKKLGDVLVAVVARDSTIRRRKGREPISPEKDRVALLSALRQVDVAVLGVEGNIYEMLEKVRPDVVALGYDQYHGEDEIVKEASKRGLKVSVVRLDSPDTSIKTTRLLQEF